MKCLIAEDGFAARKLLQRYLAEYGECDIAVNGDEAVQAFLEAIDSDAPYDLICLDINMPFKDGQEVLQLIRHIEGERGVSGLDGVKVIMTTALGDKEMVMQAFKTGCEAYLVKPVTKVRLLEEVEKLGLIKIHS